MKRTTYRERQKWVDNAGHDPLLDESKKEIRTDDNFEGSTKEKAEKNDEKL